MASWHAPSCTAPAVTVADEVPRCQSCGSVASIPGLVAQQPLPSAIPQDELGEPMNLWWPPGVPYSGQSDAQRGAAEEPPSRHRTEEPGADETKAAGQGCKSPDPILPPSRLVEAVQSSPVYDSALAADEIRLICLSAVDDDDSPLHVTLEAYRHDECPEYETTSYTWGGEDGDSTPCRPLFVGPYWDVLLLTRNCWDMLRYLRPWKGIRMVWVDAVCINQNDPVERAQQVAKMRAIYQSCMRVVVYLGGDLVSTNRAKRHHPPRHGLHEFDQVMKGSSRLVAESSTGYSLQNLLRRRYFTRVWVIQELILSRNAIIPAADVEFWAGNLTPKSLTLSSDSNPWDWESTAAPWVQFVGAGSFDGDSLYNILRRTWRSNAADPRDKIFGILGLLKSQTVSPAPAEGGARSPALSSLVPNYQITTRHAFIGFFAHILINLGMTDVLVSASGLSATSGYPSWMPDWHVQEKLRVEEGVDKRDKAQLYPATARAEAVRIEPWSCTFDVAPLSLELAQNDRRLTESYHFFQWTGVDLKRPSEDSWAERRKREPEFYDHNSWRRNASIDPSTGALSIKLCHLFQFRSSPLPEKIPNMYEVRERHFALYIVTHEGGPPLDALVPPGRNHLFCLEKEDGDPGYLLLFLRELDNTSSSPPEKTFKLILCCSFCDMFITCPSELYRWQPGLLRIDLRWSLHSVISDVLSAIGGEHALDGSAHEAGTGGETHEWAMRQMFPGTGITLRSILPVFQGILNETRGQTPTFADAYIRCLEEMLPQCLPGAMGPVEGEPSGGCEGAGVGAGGAAATALPQASTTTGGGGEDETTMLERGPRWDDYSVALRGWPQQLIDALGADGDFWQVRIV